MSTVGAGDSQQPSSSSFSSSSSSSSSSSPDTNTITSSSTPPTSTSTISTSSSAALSAYISALPKAELHLHLEGTLEPADVFAIAEKNERRHLIEHATVEAAHSARNFDDLGGFLTELNNACEVLMTEDDFSLVTMRYLQQAHEHSNVKHVEFQIGPQCHTEREGVSVATVMNGARKGIEECERMYGIVGKIILTLVKDKDIENSIEILQQCLALGPISTTRLVAVGLAGPELHIPHSKFIPLMDIARAAGLQVISHCGEEGDYTYVSDALEALHVTRIDHGVQASFSPEVCARLVRENVGLCVCPISNEKLKIHARFFPNGKQPLRQLLDAKVKVCLGSDDPAFFGAQLNENYYSAAIHNDLTMSEIWQLARNSFEMAFGMNDETKQKWYSELEKMKPTS